MPRDTFIKTKQPDLNCYQIIIDLREFKVFYHWQRLLWGINYLRDSRCVYTF